jgi:hypothetical protein
MIVIFDPLCVCGDRLINGTCYNNQCIIQPERRIAMMNEDYDPQHDAPDLKRCPSCEELCEDDLALCPNCEHEFQEYEDLDG